MLRRLGQSTQTVRIPKGGDEPTMSGEGKLWMALVLLGCLMDCSFSAFHCCCCCSFFKNFSFSYNFIWTLWSTQEPHFTICSKATPLFQAYGTDEGALTKIQVSCFVTHQSLLNWHLGYPQQVKAKQIYYSSGWLKLGHILLSK